jgi:hypothetical protein
VLRQATRGVDLMSIFVHGRGAALTAITGIGYRVRRWTTAGSGGTAITPAPRRIGTTAASTAADKVTAITAGTVSGAYQLGFGCGAAGPADGSRATRTRPSTSRAAARTSSTSTACRRRVDAAPRLGRNRRVMRVLLLVGVCE